jgi:hypothetical protein
MAAHVDPLVVGRVIGDVVDMFVPTMPLSVRFGTKDLTNGCEIKPSLAAAAPMVQIAGRLGDLFTLVSMIALFVHARLDAMAVRALLNSLIGRVCFQVMTDPDAPSPSEPTMKEWLHW